MNPKTVLSTINALENIIFKATVKNKDKEATYIGCTTTTFKERFANHKKSINHYRYKHETALSTYIWNNNLQKEPKVFWNIVRKCQPYQLGNKNCQLCLHEKYFIIQGLKSKKSLNKKTDIGNKCVHVRDATFAFHVPWKVQWGCEVKISTLPQSLEIVTWRCKKHH